MRKDIVITFNNWSNVIWYEGEYDDYSYEGSVFVVKRDNKWVGVYNMRNVVSIEIGFLGNKETYND